MRQKNPMQELWLKMRGGLIREGGVFTGHYNTSIGICISYSLINMELTVGLIEQPCTCSSVPATAKSQCMLMHDTDHTSTPPCLTNLKKFSVIHITFFCFTTHELEVLGMCRSLALAIASTRGWSQFSRNAHLIIAQCIVFADSAG